MGTAYRFECAGCGYSAEVSGGKDCGMRAVVQTMTCGGCRRLVDVLIGGEGQEGPTGDPELDRDLGRCTHCRGTDLTPWTAPGACPRCAGPMSAGNVTILWD